jgi:Gluconate 2-dehydrogenase subunit 3
VKINPSRRQVVKALVVGGSSIAGILTGVGHTSASEPAESSALLSSRQRKVLQLVGERFVPGAIRCGHASFVLKMLAVPPEHCLLAIKYFDISPPYVDSYRAALDSIDAESVRSLGIEFSEASEVAQDAILGRMLSNDVHEWRGPPAPLAYHFLRLDAVDMVYGTQAGFAALGIPYMAHIEPPSL